MKMTDFVYSEFEEYELPEFGFKIHISATFNTYTEIYSKVIPFLEDKKISFKYLKSKESIFFNLSNDEAPAESGKLITIYPKDREHCLFLLEELYSLLPVDAEGVYILSDRNYKKSNIIFYRFGCIKLKEEHLIKGLPTLRGPDGKKWQDFQKIYFDLPEWIEDLQEQQIFMESYLGNTYQIEKILKQNNGGNVYKALNKISKKEVVIKECRSHIICTDEIDRKQLRDNEWRISKNITRNIPRRVESVTEWINHYYIYDYIEGQNLIEFCNTINLFSYKRNSVDSNYKNFQKLMKCFTSLLKIINEFHKQGVVLNDIHPNNFVIDKHYNVTFIDLENSYLENFTPLLDIHSDISLKEWNQLDGKVSDCHKLGNMMLYLTGKLHIRENLEPAKELKSLLLQKGINSNLDELITFLFSSNATIEVALEKIKTTIFSSSCKNIKYNLELSIVNSLDRPEEFSSIILLNQELVQKYQNLLDNKQSVLQTLKQEKQLGFNGTVGGLMYLNAISYDESIISKGIEFVLNSLVEDKNHLKGVKISEGASSPYLFSGIAGVIQLLIDVDFDRYSSIIRELAKSLMFEFAQFIGLKDGMLGIALVLIKIFSVTQEKIYLQTARELLVSSGIMIENNHELYADFIYALNYYKKIKDANNEITI